MPIMHAHLTLSSSANIGTIENMRSGSSTEERPLAEYLELKQINQSISIQRRLVSSIETAKRILLVHLPDIA